ncbi:MAG: hypothetical protein WED87_05010, partial [Dehalococcoidia bacterium]
RNCFLHAGYWDWRGGEEFLKRRGVQTLVDARHLPSPPLNSWGTSDRAMFRAALVLGMVGVHVLVVGVSGGNETPPEISELADIMVRSTDEALEALETVARALGV